jgi:RNA polymerase sigma-70 factor (ECF subfamily)
MTSTFSQKTISTMRQENFNQLIREHHATLCAYVRVMTQNPSSINDLVQDTFITAWQNISKFDVTRDLGSWLRGIARNKWRESCRRNGREVLLDEAALAELEHSLHQLDADQPEVFERLADCRKLLPAALEHTLRSCYDDALSGREAAEQLQINEATLRKRLERAREALRL